MNHKPRKRFGQNFLHDQQVIDRIIASIAPQPSDVLLEIGPGQAALTRPLVESGAELHVVEIDRDLVETLQQKFAGISNITIHPCDALKADFTEIAGNRPFRLVGNLPYNISTPLIFYLLQWHHMIIDMHFMLQKEVVDRMAAPPGSKTYGRLSIMLGCRFTIEALFDVDPLAFDPPPAVTSAVVRLTPLSDDRYNIRNFRLFSRLVATAFSQRRKTIRNALRQLANPEQLAAAGIDAGLRPEAISIDQYVALANALEYEQPGL